MGYLCIDVGHLCGYRMNFNSKHHFEPIGDLSFWAGFRPWNLIYNYWFIILFTIVPWKGCKTIAWGSALGIDYSLYMRPERAKDSHNMFQTRNYETHFYDIKMRICTSETPLSTSKPAKWRNNSEIQLSTFMQQLKEEYQ